MSLIKKRQKGTNLKNANIVGNVSLYFIWQFHLSAHFLRVFTLEDITNGAAAVVQLHGCLDCIPNVIQTPVFFMCQLQHHSLGFWGDLLICSEQRKKNVQNYTERKS